MNCRHGVQMKRYSLNDVLRLGTLDATKDNALCIDGKEVSLFYFRYCCGKLIYISYCISPHCYINSTLQFRAGYSPNDYPSSSEWEARLLIEKSMAIKCPNIAYHLTGTKKVHMIY